ncbi:MAG: zinc metalloprotease HtpX [Nanoarchaeota archaeon]|nr:zinc metalloprotease HtpX [Nanoarchaeota archaeon]MBU4241969.1 zinc metalloprotease HtpX [Nanoarchaeota archaeon]MBU4351575.1 zinc metalloprotease HtpX [Nanoarchaeota archaeon]MBU4456165.1 zinc metalloprotease HtpX [Nanoarchaeota archaeon]MCG2720348.1 zinc metalloprotease HtpX [Nanoarchaeota archaeon]
MVKNQIKTVVLLALLTALLLWIGSFWGNQGIIIGLAFALIINFGSYFFSDKIVLRMYGAKEVKRENAPELYDIVKEVSQYANIPMPKVYIIHKQNPNAFATGRNPKHAAIACTTGILDLLSKDELKGVVAHELAHIKNRDILIATIAATIAGVISYVAMIARWGAMFGGFGRDRNNGNIIQFVVLAIITPIIAMIIQFAISRSREYLADETGSKFIHNSAPLAKALEKLETGAKYHPMKGGNNATASLFIVNPFKGSSLFTLFSTHPATAERIKRLKSMKIYT